ncbi:MAG: PAS domain S-box protein [Deltaproteobacteria bacterium]|nr:PAS domain S-box protein [Deltaproteobacteria bacterium]
MKDPSRTNSELIEEISSLKQRIQELEQAESERKRTEKALRDSESKYRFLAESAADVVFTLDINLLTTYVSPSIERMLGYTPEERIAQKVDQQLTLNSQKLAFEALMAELDQEKEKGADPNRSQTLELEYYHKDGSIKHLVTYIRGIRDSEGKLTGFYGSNHDITARKRAEDALRASEEVFRSYLEYAPDGVYMSDLEGNFLYGNRKCEEIIGYRRNELIGRNFLELNILPENSLNKAAQLLQANIEGKSTGPDEIELISKEGRLIPVEINTSVVQRMGQGIVLAFVRDITERKQAEEELRESEEKYRNILENIEDGYFEVDRAGDFTFFNSSLCRILGYPREEMSGMNYKVLTDAENVKIVFQAFNEIYATGIPSKGFEWEAIRKDGTKKCIEVSVSLIVKPGEKPTRFRGIARDVTERKRAEEELQRTLESLRKAVGATIQVMASAVELRDPYTAGHQIRSADLARAIATEMGLPHEKIEGIRVAGSIHDIGKLSIPAEILSKPTKLSEIEFRLIKEHSQKGYEMLKDVESPWPLAEMVYQHHERMDGTGYPRNLKGDDILIEARILAVADVVEAMASHRPYRATLGIEAAIEEISKERGILYDPEAVDACVKLFQEKRHSLN